MLSSNLSTVLAGLETAQKSLPTHLASAFDIRIWRGWAADVARYELTNSGLFDDGNKDQMEALIAAITGESAGLWMRLSMSGVSQGHAVETMEQMRSVPKEIIMAWAAAEKRIDPNRDMSGGIQHTPEQLAEQVIASWDNPSKALDWLNSTDPTGLKAFINSYGMSPETLSRALEIVLQAWFAGIAEIMPHEIADRVNMAFA